MPLVEIHQTTIKAIKEYSDKLSTISSNLEGYSMQDIQRKKIFCTLAGRLLEAFPNDVMDSSAISVGESMKYNFGAHNAKVRRIRIGY